MGIFGFGVKKSGDIYTAQDLQILDLYAHQVGIAVENTKLYADLKLFNEKLQLEVEKATQDLRITNSQIALRNKDLGALQKITNLITKTLDLSQITQTIADSIHTELGYIGGIIYFYDKEKKALRPSAITKTPLTQMAIKVLPKSPFEYEINDADDNLNADAFKSGSMKMSNKFSDFVHPPLPKTLIDEMQKLLGMKTVIAVPIFVENEAIGLINFGLNKNQGEVTDQELQMMRSLADQMGIVVRNVRLYDAVKSYSGKLEEANEYLKELDQTKSEFISIASHQLRSPMTGIKGYLSMLIDGDFGALDDKKKGIMKQMLDNSERLIRLINIFLNVSRIEAGRLHLDKRETQISDVIKSVIMEMSNQAKAKKLDLYFDEPKEKIPPFTADFDKLRDVILNFVDNAI
ncbi:MAG: GAF domain-containing sensor histidine kinase, partial [Patescibacteria group bacterium]